MILADPALHIVVITLAGFVMAAGVVGAIIPVIPGPMLIVGAALVYGLLSRFGWLGGFAFAVIVLLWLVTLLAGWVLPQAGGAQRGASREALLVSSLLGIVGFFLIPILGAPIGFVVGMMAMEYQRGRNLGEAWEKTKGVLVGVGIGMLVEVTASIIMVALWLVWAVTNLVAGWPG